MVYNFSQFTEASIQMKFFYLLLIVFASLQLFGQDLNKDQQIWDIDSPTSIVLRIDSTLQLPHKDNIEMAGKELAAIIYYEIDEKKRLSIEKDIIFPRLRVYNKTSEPDWKKYRAYFRRQVAQDMSPKIEMGQKIIEPIQVDSIKIDGRLTFYFAPIHGLKIQKLIYPSMDDRFLVEEWIIENVDQDHKQINISKLKQQQDEIGYYGTYSFTISTQAPDQINLKPKQSFSLPILYGAIIKDEEKNNFDYKQAQQSRQQYLNQMENNLILNTPDDKLNLLFHFSKIRAAESIFNSAMGLVHSPGGGNYYAGIWANDQVEYSGPFFPYLGYETGNIAAFNAYVKFLENIPTDGSHIPYAFEVNGTFAMGHLDRGDAAMIAYGTSLYLLNTGDLSQAQKLWPLIEWSLAYCHSKRNAAGAVASESDEMEGRIETGSANLSTSTLYYGGLKYGALLAQSLGKNDLAIELEQRREDMGSVIENYFGAKVNGVETYKYYEANTNLRHWICLPLTMGINKRKKGTIDALFNKLWTDNGVLVEYKPSESPDAQTFWDRATLYALRGVLKAGEIEVALPKLQQYTNNRLLGDHVPYPVEAYPENNMKHLSAESALYCRVFIEGLLAIEPVSFSAFTFTPNLPKEWEFLELKKMHLFGKAIDISLKKKNGKIEARVHVNSELVFNQSVAQGEMIEIDTRKN